VLVPFEKDQPILERPDLIIEKNDIEPIEATIKEKKTNIPQGWIKPKF